MKDLSMEALLKATGHAQAKDLAAEGVSEELARSESGAKAERESNAYTVEEVEAYVGQLIREGMPETWAKAAAYEKLKGYGDAEAVWKKISLEALREAWECAADDGPEADEFFRRCVSEGRLDDLVRANIIDEEEAANLHGGHPDRFDELPGWGQTLLRTFVRHTFAPYDPEKDERRYSADTYTIKHEAERFVDLEQYVPEGAMKGAMLSLGYTPVEVGPFPYSYYFDIARLEDRGM